MDRNSERPRLTEEEFLQHGGFLERLAKSLVGDEHESEDLVQGAWTTALASPPRRSGSLRGWLATIVRNTASNLHRDRDRRTTRERAAARPELALGEPTVDDQLDLQDKVVAAVRELREPYKTAVHLRYFRDLTPTEIAKRLDVSVRTVDTRLARGRDMLREALTRASGGDPRQWLAVLLPLSVSNPLPLVAVPAAPVAPGTSGASGATAGSAIAGSTVGALLGMKLQIATALSVTAVVATLWITADSESESLHPEPVRAAPGRPAAELAEVATLPEEPLLEAAVPEPASRSAVASTPTDEREAPSAAVPAAGTSAMLLTGRALDVHSLPLAGTQVRFTAGENGGGETEVALTEVDGRFRMEVTDGGSVRTDQEGLVTVLRGEFEGDGYAQELVVIAAEAKALDVRVLDETGRALVGADVTIWPPREFRSRFQVDLDASAQQVIRRVTADDGRCRADRVPVLDGLRVVADLDGYEPRELLLSGADFERANLELTFELVHLGSVAMSLRGVVIDGYGDPVPDAPVALGLLTTRSGPAGRFFFDLDGEESPFNDYAGTEGMYDLIAARVGYLPGVYRPQLDASGEPVWPDEVVLQIADPCLSVKGRVVDLEGQPLSGYLVFLAEARLFAHSRTLEATLAGRTEEFLYSTTSDAAGRFELGGLLDRDYEFAAMDRGTLIRSENHTFAAGDDDAELVVDTTDVWLRVKGRVVDGNGLPVAGVVMEPQSYTLTARGAQGVWTTTEELEPEVTAADGTFAFRELPRSATLVLRSQEIMHDEVDPTSLALAGRADGDRLDEVVLHVTRRLRLQVLLDLPEEADELRVLDGAGAPLDLHTQTGSSYLISTANQVLTEGRSRHLFVRESAETLVLLRDGVEVRRVELTLEPGDENVLRL